MFRRAGIEHFGIVFVAALLASSAGASADSYQVVYSFDGAASGSRPGGGVIRDMDGNFVGVAQAGSESINIFKVTPGGAFSVLAQTTGSPGGGLSQDNDGAIYGTIADVDLGDAYIPSSGIFRYRKSDGFKSLYKFPGQDSKGGGNPYGRLAIGPIGQVYGTVSDAYPSYGLVFKIADGKEQIMHGFTGPDGVFPAASSIVLDASKNLYGTTSYGGAFDKGVVFKIGPDKTYTVLHSFDGGDGAHPSYGVILDKNGNIYGNTYDGGSFNKGVIFKITPQGTMTTLYNFKPDFGTNPRGPLTSDAAGNLYGTAGGGHRYNGIIYQIAPSGQAFVLHRFGERAGDGSSPSGRLAADGNGYLYGTTSFGGANGYGTVFRVPKN